LKLSEESHVQIKSETIYISPTTKQVKQIPDETMFQVNFRANPKPTNWTCQWENQSENSLPCMISNGSEVGDYSVNFNHSQVLTQEGSIIINMTNGVGMSQFKFDPVLQVPQVQNNKSGMHNTEI
jgi:hypothetical protein